MNRSAASLPESCAVAFKEWEGICRALLAGRQSILLRKGGIAEGAGGFAPEHPHFWLYPTAVHEAQQGLKEPPPAPPTRDPSRVALPGLASVARVGFLGDESALDALDEFHAWTRETIAARFRYRRPGLWVLVVRVHRAEAPPTLAVTPEHAGCRSWVPLETPIATTGLVPVLTEPDFLALVRRLDDLLPPAGGP